MSDWSDPQSDPMKDIADWMEFFSQQQPTSARTAVLRITPTVKLELERLCTEVGTTIQDQVNSYARRWGFKDARIEVYD